MDVTSLNPGRVRIRFRTTCDAPEAEAFLTLDVRR